jgi:parallel beta-helix repeat protein
VQGKPETGAFVRNVVFRGLTFADADWTMAARGIGGGGGGLSDAKGYFDSQSADAAPSAIDVVGAVGFKMENCTITRSGGYGLFLGRGSKHSQVLANKFYDLGGGGVKVGEPVLRTDDAEQNYQNVIADNDIHDLGLVYAAATGIWVLQSGQNQIIHNHVHDLLYSAISVGWTWGFAANQSKGNLIAFNNIHGIKKNMLTDLGGIYILGVQPGTVIQNNLVHDISSFTYGGWGIYLDEGVSNVVVENNIVYDCKSAGFHLHYGNDDIVRNNIFAFNHEDQLEWSYRTAPPHNSLTIEHNIVDFDQGNLLGRNWKDGQYSFRDNIYYDVRGPEIHFAGKSFSDWQSSGQDRGSIIADPLFINAGNFDFRLRPNSPALKAGFRPIDMTGVGPRVRAGADAR